ncbi:MAG: putative glycoside hydrolase [Gemmatimonadetes bacterium]|nr:putative glycoside hydrolase [Gemmatimonadota bacterium]
MPDRRFSRPDEVRGLYINAWGAGSRKRSDALIELATRTEINTLVIDIKDATGYLSHRSELPLASDIGATGEIRIRDLPGLLDRLQAAGVYPIARIVVTKDPLLVKARPQWAARDTSGGVWIDQKGISWLNPFEKNVWQYHVDLAREVALMGFPEIQWDYVRFPDAPPKYMGRAHFPGAQGRTRAQGIREFLQFSQEALDDLDVHVTADVFGITTTLNNDVGIGQLWEQFIDVVDVALPMVYPSHYYAGSYGYRSPNAHPYEVVGAAMRDALRRSVSVEGAGAIRPWLQDFTLGAPSYGAPEVRAQILATHDVGIREWILWNPGSRYTEEALEPAQGRKEGFDPLIRLGGRLVPASRRHEILEEARRAKAAPDEADEPAAAASPKGSGNPR